MSTLIYSDVILRRTLCALLSIQHFCHSVNKNMELTNLTGRIFDSGSETHRQVPTDEIDECDLYPNVCGMEAGCYNTVGSYMCICHDLQPVGENHSCDKDRFLHSATPVTDLSPSNNQRSVPTESVLSSPHLQGLLPKVAIGTRNETDGNNTSSANASIISSLQTPLAGDSNLSIIAACFFAFLLVFTIILAAYLLYRGRKNLPFIPLCWIRRRSRLVSQYALEKCLQQYVTNPNYYSNSPDGAFASTLRTMELPQDSVTLLDEIGEGCFGKVHKGLYTDSTGTSVQVAVKLLKDGATAEARSDFEREVEIMSSFQHENILRLLGVVVKDHWSTPWMVFEFMHFGDLAELLRSNSPWFRIGRGDSKINLTEFDLLFIATQIASGMIYLSSQHFVHRDLATRNCLVDEQLHVKISDFGMSRDIYTSDYYKITGSRMLPIRWMAPESITYGKFSLESDVWSYGVVLWEIFTFGKQPYYGHSNDEIVKLILQGILLSPPENCPLFVCNIMAGCWKTEPRHRFTFPEIHAMLVQNSPSRTSTIQQTPDKDDIPTNAENYLQAIASTSV